MKHWQSVRLSASSPKVSNTSMKVFDQFRGKQYANIFALLDGDDDGKISAEAIYLDGIDDSTLRILCPLFTALDEGLELDITGFVNYMEELWSKLDFEARAHLLKRENKQEHHQEEFKTGLSPKSYRFAKDKNKLMSGNIYERFQHTQQLNTLKAEKIKEITSSMEMQECTFRPVIKKYKPRNK